MIQRYNSLSSPHDFRLAATASHWVISAYMTGLATPYSVTMSKLTKPTGLNELHGLGAACTATCGLWSWDVSLADTNSKPRNASPTGTAPGLNGGGTVIAHPGGIGTVTSNVVWE